ncbi:hypothetical protein [Crocosphaera sp. XPORK-15E]|uniref:hypothetical protein n=1 Tax=Crocosphaera sp. XPORK-15E TaxID=3110247 RepID=UPI002B2043DD|nr:hypothetical protein [Crocosphaera sp. XPORK-15E]MEA5532605.1 hypothetical protein [Crocosphaera sp. XPORK-15E]
MRVWISAVFVLFVLVQLYQWIKGFILPLPIYVLAGSFLAIASNYEKGLGTLLKSASLQNQALSSGTSLTDNTSGSDSQ